MANYLHIALRSLVENHDHLLFQITGRGRGNPGMTPDERSCVTDAVRYIRAARGGVIDNLDPVETVLTAYTEEAPDATLDQRTVERWLARRSSLTVSQNQNTPESLDIIRNGSRGL